jgi:hypothetical protein
MTRERRVGPLIVGTFKNRSPRFHLWVCRGFQLRLGSFGLYVVIR